MSYDEHEIEKMGHHRLREIMMLGHDLGVFDHTNHSVEFTEKVAQILRGYKHDVIRIMRND